MLGSRLPADRVAGRHVQVHAPAPGAVEDQPPVYLEERVVRADEEGVTGRVLDLDLDGPPAGVQLDRPVAEQHLARLHGKPPCPPVLGCRGASAASRIGRSTFSTRVPSPKRHSILIVPSSSGTPSSTSSSVSTLEPTATTSSYDAPPRAASCISSQISASASG